jgi:predicted transcriptional regulator
MSTTTVRLSRQLHDRLSLRARAGHTTLAGVIEQALDVAEREEFWSRAAATMGSAAGKADLRTDSSALSGSLKDGLDPDETWDDVW